MRFLHKRKPEKAGFLWFPFLLTILAGKIVKTFPTKSNMEVLFRLLARAYFEGKKQKILS